VPTPTALRTSILDAVAEVVGLLSLGGLERRVFVRTGRRASAGETYPAVVLRRADEPDGDNRMSFHKDSPAYPVELLYVFSNPLGTDADLGAVDVWNQDIKRAFREPEVLRSRVAGVWDVEVRSLREIDPQDDRYQGVVGGLILRVKTHEGRGIGA
jgi:hypothetical protein